jgi:hypothetical protein
MHYLGFWSPSQKDQLVRNIVENRIELLLLAAPNYLSTIFMLTDRGRVSKVVFLFAFCGFLRFLDAIEVKSKEEIQVLQIIAYNLKYRQAPNW